jgi:hypothetical protein
MKTQDLTGKKFGRWTVVSFNEAGKRAKYWHCICDCGTKRSVFGSDLKRGGSLSCGCLKDEASADRLAIHGQSRTVVYRAWQQMHQRCYNSRKRGFELYGGRGIAVTSEWHDFNAFNRDMGSTWRKGLSLDRIDTDGNYCKGNCRWSTPKEQGNNRRTNRIINTPEGPMNVTQAGERFGINPITIYARIRYGWSEDQLLNPVH